MTLEIYNVETTSITTVPKTFARTVKFAEGLGDGIEEMGAVVRSYIDDPDKLFESGETLANIPDSLR